MLAIGCDESPQAAAGKSWSAQQIAVSKATSFSPTIAPTGISAAPVVFAWTTSSRTIGYGILGFLGFESIGTVPQAGTDAAPTLDFMSAAPGETMYLAWKGTSTDRVFFDEVADFSDSSFGPGSWAGQAALPAALTSTGPRLTSAPGSTHCTSATARTTSGTRTPPLRRRSRRVQSIGEPLLLSAARTRRSRSTRAVRTALAVIVRQVACTLGLDTLGLVIGRHQSR
jgi:hypothetical protein